MIHVMFVYERVFTAGRKKKKILLRSSKAIG